MKTLVLTLATSLLAASVSYADVPSGASDKLWDACMAGDLAKANQAIARGANPNACANGIPMLGFATDAPNNIAIMKFLISKGANVNFLCRENGSYQTALEQAAHAVYEYQRPREQSVPIGLAAAKFLLKNGADVNLPGSDETALVAASHAGYVEMVDLLLRAGANPNIPGRELGNYPLHSACYRGAEKPEYVKNYVAITQLLIAAGADVNALDNDKSTPLHDAARYGSPAQVKLLVKARAKLDVYNRLGRTPLLEAVTWGKAPQAQILLEAGANPNLRDKKGKSPLQLAEKRRAKALAELIRSYGGQE